MNQEEWSDCKLDDRELPVLELLKNTNNINSSLGVDEIVQIWKDVCDCTDSKFYKEKIDYFLKTIDSLKRDIRVVKLQNKKLVQENCEIKNELKVLSERLVDLRQLDGNNQQNRIVDPKKDARTPIQGSSADHSWLFTTQQWLENIFDDMNPSTDADNFENDDMIGNTLGGMSINDEDVMKRFRAASYFDEYDEVFEVEEEEVAAEGSTTYSGRRTARTRRISDVIDSIGDVSPSYSSKEKSNSFSYEVSAIRHKEFQLQSPPCGRPIPTMTDSPSSPPMTPGSDLGYGSTGMPTPPSNAHYRPKSFRFSASSVDISSSPSQWDTQLDAKPIGEEAQSSMSNCLSWTKPEAAMPSQKDSRSYNMKHLRRGKAVIFNHEEFRDMPPRKGSSVDVAKLTSALTALGFAVQTYHDLEVEKLKNIITELSIEDHSDADCIVITVLTHGLSTGCLMAKDYAYPTEHLWTPFTADKCPSLAGKPKMFFIQACRGEKLDGGIRLISRHQTDTGALSYKIPTMADFLLAFSTFEGFYSWRHPETGTWFIQCLCQVLEEEGGKSSLQDILLEVSRRVAIEYESYNDLYAWQHEQKQVPQINSTLLRQVYFSPKD